MTQEINNREFRQKVIRELLADLHAGKSLEEVKARFEEVFQGVAASEISEAEQALIDQGLPVEEIQKLCDVHAAVFKGSIEEIHAPSDPTEIPGHPVHTLKAENRALEKLIENRLRPHLDAFTAGASHSHEPARSSSNEAAKTLDLTTGSPVAELIKDLELLDKIDIHYVKKEHLFFPYMEKHGITAPPKVMWAVDDEIRNLTKEALSAVNQYASAGQGDVKADKEIIKGKVESAVAKITDMIMKENEILLPMVVDVFTDNEWMTIAEESRDLGYYLIPPPPKWTPRSKPGPEPKTEFEHSAPTGSIVLPTGALRLEELTYLLNTLPVDITFVDKDDIVRYFSQGSERIFPRTKAIIGRRVADCHPPASVHIVEGILESFKSGKRDHEDFWIKMAGKYVYIRYFAVRDADGGYLGTLEVTQDIKPIQETTGEKRLVMG